MASVVAIAWFALWYFIPAPPHELTIMAGTIAFADLPARLPDILDAKSGVLCQLIAYQAAHL